MAKYPQDQFDTLPEDLSRVGAHRAPKKRGGGWLGFLAAVVSTVVLVIGGLYAVSLVNDSVEFNFPGFASEEEVVPSESPTPEIAPITDPSTLADGRKYSITILNGTTSPDVDEAASAALKEAKWKIAATTAASETDIDETIVYYRDPADEDIARGLIAILGVGDVRESTAFLGSSINIVLGSDYVPLP
jgi:hypothetical protein